MTNNDQRAEIERIISVVISYTRALAASAKPDERLMDCALATILNEAARELHNTLFADKKQPAYDDTSTDHARLIAAAPDLLEACKRVLLHSHPKDDPEFIAVQEAIAKAEGEA